MVEREVRVYRDSNGNKPFSEWRTSLAPESRVIIDQNITKVRTPGFKNYKRVGEIYELRMHIDGGYRVYFGIEGRELIVLLSGGDKDTQGSDIRKAERLWKEFKSAV